MKKYLTASLSLMLLLAVGLASRVKAQAGPDVFTIVANPAVPANTLTGHYQTSYRHPHVLPTDISPTPCVGAGYGSPGDPENPDCTVATNWPESCPPGLNCDPGGAVELSTASGISIPYYLGFPNNGFLLDDCALYYSTIQFNARPDGTMSDGTKVGDTWYFTASTVNPDTNANPSGASSCTGYALGVTFSVTTNWVVSSVATKISYGGVSHTYTYVLTGGSGVAQYDPTATSKRFFYPYYSKQKSCLS